MFRIFLIITVSTLIISYTNETTYAEGISLNCNISETDVYYSITYENDIADVTETTPADGERLFTGIKLSKTPKLISFKITERAGGTVAIKSISISRDTLKLMRNFTLSNGMLIGNSEGQCKLVEVDTSKNKI